MQIAKYISYTSTEENHFYQEKHLTILHDRKQLLCYIFGKAKELVFIKAKPEDVCLEELAYPGGIQIKTLNKVAGIPTHFNKIIMQIPDTSFIGKVDHSRVHLI